VVERVAHARAEAQRETFDRLAHEFTEARCTALDGLLVTDPENRTTRLRWLSIGPVEASPAAVKAEVAKLASCAAWARTPSTCRCCPPTDAGSWPQSAVA
jgi:hypothetical protein